VVRRARGSGCRSAGRPGAEQGADEEEDADDGEFAGFGEFAAADVGVGMEEEVGDAFGDLADRCR